MSARAAGGRISSSHFSADERLEGRNDGELRQNLSVERQKNGYVGVYHCLENIPK